MRLELRRVIIFTEEPEKMAAFYSKVLGLAQTGEEAGWVTFDAGAMQIALHRGGSMIGRRPPKLVFFAQDVAAVREELVTRGARMGRLLSSGELAFCDGKDPDGNPFQVSNRC